MSTATLPVVLIGAGPVGLAAAAHLLERGLAPLLLEAGSAAAAALRDWGHVRLFSPWEYTLDAAALRLLAPTGWQVPDPAAYPTGAELRERYLLPLAAVPAIATRLHLDSRVVAVTRQGRDRMKDSGREGAPFVVRVRQHGRERDLLARAVIDASGTWARPNPLGAAGIPARGEAALAARIDYAVPDVRGARRADFAGRRVLVVGSGHSAFNVLAELVALKVEEPATTIHWAVRRPSLAGVLSDGERDPLTERGRPGQRVRQWVEQGVVSLHAGIEIDQLDDSAAGIVASDGQRQLPAVDRVVASTGFRPDLAALDELRLGLDPALQAPSALAPLIDPKLHRCGTVRPHGALELAHPERDFYLVGMKSYGRAPTFLLRTGYEQVRSVAAALAGDGEAARRVDLVLPEAGGCRTAAAGDQGAIGCCAPAPSAAAAGGDAGAAAPRREAAACAR
jgi:thioredoxin reductase